MIRLSGKVGKVKKEVVDRRFVLYSNLEGVPGFEDAVPGRVCFGERLQIHREHERKGYLAWRERGHGFYGRLVRIFAMRNALKMRGTGVK